MKKAGEGEEAQSPVIGYNQIECSRGRTNTKEKKIEKEQKKGLNRERERQEKEMTRKVTR